MKNKCVFSLIFTICTICHSIWSQNPIKIKSGLEKWIDKQFIHSLDSLHIPGAAIVLVRGDSILHCNGYGLADIENNIPVSDSTLFGIASISKTFVGVSIMQLYEQGKLSLDKDINDYLTSIQVNSEYDRPITVRHLLTHTAGFDESNLANRVRTQKEIIPLSEFLENRLPPQIRPPGEVLSYSNYGYALLGLIVEDISELSFDEFVRLNILKPLEMNKSSFKRPNTYQYNYSKSYSLKGNRSITFHSGFPLQYPAVSMSSSAREMSHYISMFLKHGKYKNKRILDSLTVSKMFTPAFKHYDKAQNGWLFGFYDDHCKGLKIVLHEGDIDGFASTLMLIPEKDIGLFISINASSLTDRTNRFFIQGFTDDLLNKILPEYSNESNRVRIPETNSVKKPLKSLRGSYRHTRYANSTLEKLGLLIGLTPEIHINWRNDSLFLVENNELLSPISDLTFFAEKQKKYVAFKEAESGGISYFFSDNQSFHKLKWFETIKFQILIIGVIVLIFIFLIFGYVARILLFPNRKMHILGKVNITVALLSLLFLTTLGLVLLKTDPNDFVYGLPFILKASLVLPIVIIALVLWSWYATIKAIIVRKVEFWKFNYVFNIVAILFIGWLYFWNLIGFNY